MLRLVDRARMPRLVRRRPSRVRGFVRWRVRRRMSRSRRLGMVGGTRLFAGTTLLPRIPPV